MKILSRLLIPFLLLFTVGITHPVPNVDVVNTSVTSHSSNINTEELRNLPVTRNAAGALQLSPGAIYDTDVPSGSAITSTSQFIDGAEVNVLVTINGSNSTGFKVCDLDNFEAICVTKGGNTPLSVFPGAQYGGNATAGVVNFISKSGSNGFSQGRLFNPRTSNFKPAKFPFYYAPEKDFPLSAISSAGVSADGTASFQIINFTGDSYFFFRENNAQFRPVGQFTKISLGNVGFVSSGSLSNRIDNPTGPDYRFFAYRQYSNVGTSNLRSQVKLKVYDADTWSRIGNPYNYTPVLPSKYPMEEQSQSVEIEPGGAFLAFTRYHGASDRNLGYLRGISLTGRPSGAQKLFTPIVDMKKTEFGINALDIIRVPLGVSPDPQ